MTERQLQALEAKYEKRTLIQSVTMDMKDLIAEVRRLNSLLYGEYKQAAESACQPLAKDGERESIKIDR